MKLLLTTLLLMIFHLVHAEYDFHSPYNINDFQYYDSKVHSRPSYVNFTWYDPHTGNSTVCSNQLKKGLYASALPIGEDNFTHCDNYYTGWYWEEKGHQIVMEYLYQEPGSVNWNLITSHVTALTSKG
jgi:hypothetical protein